MVSPPTKLKVYALLYPILGCFWWRIWSMFNPKPRILSLSFYDCFRYLLKIQDIQYIPNELGQYVLPTISLVWNLFKLDIPILILDGKIPKQMGDPWDPQSSPWLSIRSVSAVDPCSAPPCLSPCPAEGLRNISCFFHLLIHLSEWGYLVILMILGILFKLNWRFIRICDVFIYIFHWFITTLIVLYVKMNGLSSTRHGCV